MIKHIAFRHNGNLYATCYGIGDYAFGKCKYRNIFNPMTADKGELKQFKQLLGGLTEYDLPRLEDADIKFDDETGTASGTGTITVGDEAYSVVFDSYNISVLRPDGTDINTETEDFPATEPEDASFLDAWEPTNAVEAVTEPVSVLETATDEQDEALITAIGKMGPAGVGSTHHGEVTEEVIERASDAFKEVDPVPQPIGEVQTFNEVELSTEDFMNPPVFVEPRVSSLLDEAADYLYSEPAPCTEFLNSIRNPLHLTHVVQELPVGFMNPPIAAPVVNRYEDGEPQGISVNVDNVIIKPAAITLGTTFSSQGISFGELPTRRRQPEVSRSVLRRPLYNRQVFAEKEEEELYAQPLVPSSELAAAVAASEEKLMESWRTPVSSPQKPEVFGTIYSSTGQSAPVPETEDEMEKESLRQEYLKTLDPDIASVVSQLPLSITGSIVEFTTNCVDESKLSMNADAYCIDNRWHKAGKWYCIDVVPSMSRYFFNSRLGISKEISQEVLRKWASLNESA